MSYYQYTAVVGVRKRKAAPNAQDRFCVCRVPDGSVVDNSALVLFGNDDGSELEKGICVSETIFVDKTTLDLICAVTGTTEPLPEVKAIINLNWISTNKPQSKEVCN